MAAAQEARIVETKTSTRPRSGFVVSQCFYTAATFERSVSLEVTRRDSSRPGPAARDDWKRIFHAERRTTAKSEAPQLIAGLGDEAYWTSNQTAGALYVLRNDAYFRLSLGGWRDHKIRLKKTEQLARKISGGSSGTLLRRDDRENYAKK